MGCADIARFYEGFGYGQLAVRGWLLHMGNFEIAPENRSA
jgi:hypothetical protein